ncbi:riboflavin-specific deaminase [Coprinopsis cinerea okayama7|uniref:2,5-diamino-6-ribosylamino-4(3H)-pyrimidinone 5'-phosphate reductase n=1 Tax=Coprinopsis cinerea (strain Okayama-7 / 130 / ATCC MYA-4618 / FGSC 9003) TaxID=240176 RepID=A8N2R3_COPC7|nr:riboflavin-specific deaminase [Coprinopsis cinerea okayama7\|eukprot:XP_001829197.1 riboflavin-specific deaminase [Coprinopsis cinerea okayama7\
MDFLHLSRSSDKLDLTLTFAQSLDAKIAGQNGSQIALSCSESMQMTHRLRSLHDAILVGANTAINDNPQLNTRLLPVEDQKNPRPIILDTNLRLGPNCKLLQNYASGRGVQPWLLTPGSDDPDWLKRKSLLEDAGARIVIYAPSGGPRADDVPSILASLSTNGIRSLMVEGGAAVIQSFVTAHLKYGRIIDRVIITVAPVFVGEGVTYTFPVSNEGPPFVHKQTFLAGTDAVMVLDCNP